MQTAHVLLWCGISVLIIGFGVIAWCVRKIWVGMATISGGIDALARDNQKLTQDLVIVSGSLSHVSERLKAMEAWAASWVPFQENIAKQQSARVDDLNTRLISIETENKITEPKKRDEDGDPLGGPRSWSAVASSIERAEGVRL